MTIEEFKQWFLEYGPLVMITIGYFCGFVMFAVGIILE